MKKILFITSFILISLSLFWKKISNEKAKTRPINILKSQSNIQFKSALAINLTLVPEILPIMTFFKKHKIKTDMVENPYYFIFNVNDNDDFYLLSSLVPTETGTGAGLGKRHMGKVQ